MRQIIAMGGGGFSMERNLALDVYILQQSGKAQPRVCFLPTASGDAADYVVKFYAAFVTLECQPTHLYLLRPDRADIASFLLSQDVIYVGGGNTANMLALWRLWGLHHYLRRAWQRGVVLAGLSAGAICWFQQGVTDSVPGQLRPLGCLGFLPGSCCPHYDGEPQRRPAYHRLLQQDAIADGYALDDGAAIHFVGTTLHRVVVSRPDARAYRVQLEEGEVREKALAGELLAERAM